MSAHNITANKNCNQEEIGNSCVQVSPKIICAKGIKQVCNIWNVTMIDDVNAVFSHVLPVLIFPRVHFKIDMLTGASAVSIAGANTTGWSNYGFDFTI
jgi:hypothetical protein